MAGNSAEMKVKATMDNSDLKKRAKESKEALRDFAKVGEDAVSSLGNAFGVNTGKIEQMISSVRGLGENLSKSSNTGTAALGNLLKGVNGLSAGIAGLGIGAAVAGFKMLKDEAETFKNTIAGANIELQTQVYIDTYRQYVSDFLSLGESAAKAEANIKALKGTFGSQFKLFLLGGGLAGLESGNLDMVTQYQETMNEANSVAEKAAELQGEILGYIDQLSSKSVEWAATEQKIAEYKRIAYDTTVDTVERQNKLAEVQRLTNERYQEEFEIKNNIAVKTQQLNALVNSSREAVHKENELRVQALNVLTVMSDRLKELLEKQASLAKQAQAEAQARKEAADYAAKMAQSRADLAAWGQMAANVGSIELPAKAVAMKMPGLSIPVKPELDTSAVIDLTNELQSILTSSFENIGTSLGGLIGDLATGGDAWSNFSNAAISAFGDMAISVGKMAISTGTATLGIKAALESLNGYVAIAAGVALVALGTAVKSSLSNIASGNYSAAGSVATSTGSYGSSIGTSFDTRDITVNVKGSLRADGNQLLAVIENENTRRNHTT